MRDPDLAQASTSQVSDAGRGKYKVGFNPTILSLKTATPDARQRPYRAEYTGSLSNSEVNRGRALSVGEWGTVSEAIRVLLAF